MAPEKAIVTHIFYGNGGGVLSCVWVRSASGEFNFDMQELEQARQYQRGTQIMIRVENGKAQPIA